MTLTNKDNHHHTIHINKLQCTNNTGNYETTKRKFKEELAALVASIMYRLIITDM
jgi:hypothetical protein